MKSVGLCYKGAINNKLSRYRQWTILYDSERVCVHSKGINDPAPKWECINTRMEYWNGGINFQIIQIAYMHAKFTQ